MPTAAAPTSASSLEEAHSITRLGCGNGQPHGENPHGVKGPLSAAAFSDAAEPPAVEGIGAPAEENSTDIPANATFALAPQTNRRAFYATKEEAGIAQSTTGTCAAPALAALPAAAKGKGSKETPISALETLLAPAAVSFLSLSSEAANTKTEGAASASNAKHSAAKAFSLDFIHAKLTTHIGILGGLLHKI